MLLLPTHDKLTWAKPRGVDGPSSANTSHLVWPCALEGKRLEASAVIVNGILFYSSLVWENALQARLVVAIDPGIIRGT